MASDVDIVNSALSKLGARPILSLSDPTPEGRIANRRYSTIRDDFLRAHPWNFAATRTELAASAVTPSWGFQYAYPLPTDYIRINAIDDVNLGSWRVELHEGKPSVMADKEPPLRVLYVSKVTDADLMPASFREALAAKCAAEWAEALTGTSAKVQELHQLERLRVAEARAVDGQEQDGVDAFKPTLWTDSRL